MRYFLPIFMFAALFCPTLADVDEAKAAAEQHYALAKAGDEAAWAATFNKSDYELYQGAIENGIRGHVLEGRWRSAQRKAQNGVTWRYLRTDKKSPEECKFFFERRLENGKRDGYPVPILVISEDGEWKIQSATY